MAWGGTASDPRPPPPAPLSFPFSELTLRRLALAISLSRVWCPPPRIGVSEEAQDCLAAPLVGKEVPELEPALPPPGLLPHLYPQDLLLGIPLGVRLQGFASGSDTTGTDRWAGSPSSVGTVR